MGLKIAARGELVVIIILTADLPGLHIPRGPVA